MNEPARYTGGRISWVLNMAGSDPIRGRPDGPVPAGDETATSRAGLRPARLVTSLRALRDLVIGVFVLAGLFDVLSGDPLVHGMALFAVAIALGGDAMRRRRGTVYPAAMAEGTGAPGVAAMPSARLRLTPGVVLAGAAFATVAGPFARYSWPATLSVLPPAAAAVALAWRESARPRPEPARVDPLGALTWASVFIAFALWELAALLLQPSLTTSSYSHPTVSTLMDPVLASHAGRSAFLAVWLAVGWSLLQL